MLKNYLMTRPQAPRTKETRASGLLQAMQSLFAPVAYQAVKYLANLPLPKLPEKLSRNLLLMLCCSGTDLKPYNNRNEKRTHLSRSSTCTTPSRAEGCSTSCARSGCSRSRRSTAARPSHRTRPPSGSRSTSGLLLGVRHQQIFPGNFHGSATARGVANEQTWYSK